VPQLFWVPLPLGLLRLPVVSIETTLLQRGGMFLAEGSSSGDSEPKTIRQKPGAHLPGFFIGDYFKAAWLRECETPPLETLHIYGASDYAVIKLRGEDTARLFQGSQEVAVARIEAIVKKSMTRCARSAQRSGRPKACRSRASRVRPCFATPTRRRSIRSAVSATFAAIEPKGGKIFANSAALAALILTPRKKRNTRH
jgi:hypothetical protein